MSFWDTINQIGNGPVPHLSTPTSTPVPSPYVTPAPLGPVPHITTTPAPATKPAVSSSNFWDTINKTTPAPLGPVPHITPTVPSATPPPQWKDTLNPNNPIYGPLKDLIQGPSLGLSKFVIQPAYNFASSATELATGNPLPKLNIPSLFPETGTTNFIDGSSYQQKYVDNITAAINAKYKAQGWANMTPGNDPEINSVIAQAKQIVSKTDDQIMKDAYKQTFLGGLMDAISLAEPIKGGIGFGIKKLAPQILMDSSVNSISKDTLYDLFSGRKTAGQLGITPEMQAKITSKLASLDTQGKAQFLQGFDLLNAKPSFIGKMFGVTDAQAKAMLDAYGGQVRETPSGALPGYKMNYQAGGVNIKGEPVGFGKEPVPNETPAEALARSEAYAKQAHPTTIVPESTFSTDIQGNQVEQQFIRSATQLEKTSPTAKSKGFQSIPDKEGFQKVFKPYGEQGAGYYYNKVLPTPDQLQSQIDLTKELLAEHPGTALNKLIPDKIAKTNYLDKVKGDNLTYQQRKSNAAKDKRLQKLQDILPSTEKESSSFDNYDVIEQKKGEAKALKERLKALQEQKKNLPKVSLKSDIRTGKPIRLTATEQAMVGTGKRSVPFMPKASQPPVPTPSPIDTTTGEGRSIEIQGHQVSEEASQHTIPPKDVSLIDTISKEVTNVKDKVNIIDYIRTPDRVLKKIGLEKEGQFLRTQYDKYLKELPKNIEKITAWSKRASKGGNADIFNYLDGKAIDLKPQDKVIATEIKAWLKQWADRLGLPNDDRITYYITHIFDQELIKKEFPEELAKLIDNKLPSEVYDPFLQKRLGTLGYRQDTWKALDAYVKRATRKVNLDPALEKIKDASGKLEKSQYDYAKHYVANINMRPSKIDTLIDNTLKQVIGYRLGQRPLLTITKFLRDITYRAMLGLNPASALKNISQGINAYAILGEKYTTIGYIKLFNKGAHEELLREGVLNGGFIEDRALSATSKAIETFDKVLFSFFQGAEHINRGMTYFGAKTQFLDGKAAKSDIKDALGFNDINGEGVNFLTEKNAIDYAKFIVRKTQFVFGKIDTPLILSSDLGKTLLQFQSFTTKQVEFLTEMAKKAATGDEKAKNLFGLLRYAIAGTIFVYTVGQAFNMKMQDLLPFWRFGVPPSLNVPYQIGSATFNAPNQYNQPRTIPQKLKDIGNSLWGIVPAGTQLKKTFEGYNALKQGKSTDSAGRVQYDVGGTPLKNAQALIFGKYAGQGAQDYYNAGMTYAESTLANLKKLPKEEAKAKFVKMATDNPALYKSVLEVAKKQALGVTKDDEKLLNLGVANKARAKEVAKQLNKLDNKEAKKALFVEYYTKKILTPEVVKQLAEFLKK
jgi:hypothetical protein